MLRDVSAEGFCPEALKEEIRASDSNRGSLVRVCLLKGGGAVVAVLFVNEYTAMVGSG